MPLCMYIFVSMCIHMHICVPLCGYVCDVCMWTVYIYTLWCAFVYMDMCLHMPVCICVPQESLTGIPLYRPTTEFCIFLQWPCILSLSRFTFYFLEDFYRVGGIFFTDNNIWVSWLLSLIYIIVLLLSWVCISVLTEQEGRAREEILSLFTLWLIIGFYKPNYSFEEVESFTWNACILSFIKYLSVSAHMIISHFPRWRKALVHPWPSLVLQKELLNFSLSSFRTPEDLSYSHSENHPGWLSLKG